MRRAARLVRLPRVRRDTRAARRRLVAESEAYARLVIQLERDGRWQRIDCFWCCVLVLGACLCVAGVFF